VQLALSLQDKQDEVVPVAFPYFGGIAAPHFTENDQGGDILLRNVPEARAARRRRGVRRDRLRPGARQLRRRRGLGGGAAKSFDDDVPYTPKWQEKVTGVKAADVITVARQFADNADKTHGKSMVIIARR